MRKTQDSDGSVVLFDGVCNFCNRAVNLIIRHDAKGRFRFASLQSPAGRAALARFSQLRDVDSVVLIENGRWYTESSAALRISKGMDGGWKIFYALAAVPKPLRDWAYRRFAKARYRLFGKRDACMVPSPEARKRFLPDA